MPKHCPVCNKAETAEFKPFCSKRCADIDLGKWFKGDYGIPVIEHDDLPDESGLEEEEPQH